MNSMMKGLSHMQAVEVREGTILERELTLEDVSGMHSAKRVLEIALAGSYGAVFLYNTNSQAVDLMRAGKRIATTHGLVFHGLAYPVCPCGCYGSKTSKCLCKHTEISRHLAKLARRQHEFDLWFDACRAKPVESMTEPNEPETDVVRRILAARRNIQSAMMPDYDAVGVLKHWQEYTGRTSNTDRILGIASTIAKLDGITTTLRTLHVGEAIQYQIQAI